MYQVLRRLKNKKDSKNRNKIKLNTYNVLRRTKRKDLIFMFKTLKTLLVVTTLISPIMMGIVEYNNIEQWEKDCRKVREQQLMNKKYSDNVVVLTCKNQEEYVEYRQRKDEEIQKRIEEEEKIQQEKQEIRQEKLRFLYNIDENFERTYYNKSKLSELQVYTSENYEIRVHKRWEKWSDVYPDTEIIVEKNGNVIREFEL